MTQYNEEIPYSKDSYIFQSRHLTGLIECDICHDSWHRGDQTIEWYIKWFCDEEEARHYAYDHMDFFHDNNNVAIKQEVREVNLDTDTESQEHDPNITYQNTHYRKFHITETLPNEWLMPRVLVS